jgi:hypothetical protein
MRSWRSLLALDDDELGRIDLAEVHLACADDLPGFGPSDLDLARERITEFARLVWRETEDLLPRFRHNPGQFGNSEAYFRLHCLVTVLQRDCGIHTDGKLMENLAYYHGGVP